jgi:predicted transcriptional regulator
MTSPDYGDDDDSSADDLPLRFTVRLSPEAGAAFSQLAQMHGWSTAAEMRSALRAHLERYGLGEAMPARHERARNRPRD